MSARTMEGCLETSPLFPALAEKAAYKADTELTLTSSCCIQDELNGTRRTGGSESTSTDTPRDIGTVADQPAEACTTNVTHCW